MILVICGKRVYYGILQMMNCTRIVVPKRKRKDILMAAHNNPLAGHLSV